MKAIKCTSCGSTDLIKKDGFWICQHCGTKNYFTEEELPAKESDITLDSDVEVLFSPLQLRLLVLLLSEFEKVTKSRIDMQN